MSTGNQGKLHIQTGLLLFSTVFVGGVISWRSQPVAAVTAGRPSSRTFFAQNADHLAQDTTSTDEIMPWGSTGLALTGAGVTIGMAELGLPRTDHVELAGSVLNLSGGDVQGHATHVASTMVGHGICSEAAGVAPGADLLAWHWDYPAGGIHQTSVAAAAAWGASVFNISMQFGGGWNKQGGWNWGEETYANDGTSEDVVLGRYLSMSAAYDGVIRANPTTLVCVSAGNGNQDGPPVQPAVHSHDWDGAQHHDVHPLNGLHSWSPTFFSSNCYETPFDTLTWLAVAKNVITVGAVGPVVGGIHPETERIDSAGNRLLPQVSILQISARGPTNDGRIKPDVVANGYLVFGATQETTTSYGQMKGTSQASPIVAGTAALLVEHFRNTHAQENPLASTLKALLIHGADDCGLAGPDYTYGWGLVNAKASAHMISLDQELSTSIVEGNLFTGETWERRFFCNGTQHPKVTLVWTDPPGVPGSGIQSDVDNPALVNDLDLRLIAEGGQMLRPWVLDPMHPDWEATHGDNVVDNVEQVLDDDPWGNYRLVVSHKGTLVGGSQQFSLVISGLSQPAPTELVGQPPSASYANGSAAPSLSIDARIVAFDSAAANLVSGDTEGQLDVFVQDRVQDALRRVSVDAQGHGGNDASFSPVLSADGQHVAFLSRATNLTTDDPADFLPGVANVFVRDLNSNTTMLASRGLDDKPAWAECHSLVISADGQSVAYVSQSANLGISGFTAQVFSWRIGDAHPSLVSRSPDTPPSGMGPLEGDGASYSPQISDNGSRILFLSGASNLLSPSASALGNVFVSTGPASVSAVNLQFQDDAPPPPGNWYASELCASADFGVVAVTRYQGNHPGIYVGVLNSGQLALHSRLANGNVASSFGIPRLSTDGGQLLMYADGRLLARDIGAQKSFDVGLDEVGTPIQTGTATFSPDGRFVAFSSGPRVFVHDRWQPYLEVETGQTEGLHGVLLDDGSTLRLKANLRWHSPSGMTYSCNGQDIANTDDGLTTLTMGPNTSGAYCVRALVGGQASRSRTVLVQVRTALSFVGVGPTVVSSGAGQNIVLRANVRGWPVESQNPSQLDDPDWDPTSNAARGWLLNGSPSYFLSGDGLSGPSGMMNLNPLLPTSVGSYVFRAKSRFGVIQQQVAQVNLVNGTTPDPYWIAYPFSGPLRPMLSRGVVQDEVPIEKRVIQIRGELPDRACGPFQTDLMSVTLIAGNPSGPLCVRLDQEDPPAPDNSVTYRTLPGQLPEGSLKIYPSGIFEAQIKRFMLPLPIAPPTAGTAPIRFALTWGGMYGRAEQEFETRWRRRWFNFSGGAWVLSGH